MAAGHADEVVDLLSQVGLFDSAAPTGAAMRARWRSQVFIGFLGFARSDAALRAYRSSCDKDSTSRAVSMCIDSTERHSRRMWARFATSFVFDTRPTIAEATAARCPVVNS
jgi:NaMN:DMB phosphoribosyltransferase